MLYYVTISGIRTAFSSTSVHLLVWVVPASFFQHHSLIVFANVLLSYPVPFLSYVSSCIQIVVHTYKSCTIK